MGRKAGWQLVSDIPVFGRYLEVYMYADRALSWGGRGLCEPTVSGCVADAKCPNTRRCCGSGVVLWQTPIKSLFVTKTATKRVRLALPVAHSTAVVLVIAAVVSFNTRLEVLYWSWDVV